MTIFIVEDDPWYGELLEYHLALNPDHTIQRFESGAALLKELHQRPDVITLDYSLPDFEGAELLAKLKAEVPETYVIVVSGQEDVSTAIGLLKSGAYDYVVKDDEARDRVWNAVNNISEQIALKKEVEHLREAVGLKYDFGKAIIGNSPALQKVFGMMEKAAKTNITVSITGETGTGKELAAKAIHYNSALRKKPFVAVNVSSIPAELIESELFGHERGSFTGAISRRLGKFEEANGGTIFLDEIAELELSLQAKLLRVLQEREVTRVGGNKPMKLDVRVLVATHRDLSEEVKAGNFREDLYYRLLGLPVKLPPLRERGNDILLLARQFLTDFCKSNKLPALKFSKEACQKLLAYPFPGNVRELKAVAELAAVMASTDQVQAEDIAFHGSGSLNDLLEVERTLKEYNQLILDHFLEKYQNNIPQVAEKLAIGVSTIYRMQKRGSETEAS